MASIQSTNVYRASQNPLTRSIIPHATIFSILFIIKGLLLTNLTLYDFCAWNHYTTSPLSLSTHVHMHVCGGESVWEHTVRETPGTHHVNEPWGQCVPAHRWTRVEGGIHHATARRQWVKVHWAIGEELHLRVRTLELAWGKGELW